MGIGQRLSLVFAIAVLPACQAAAQTLPGPTDAPPAAAPPPWLLEARCRAEFIKLWEEVQKNGFAAKAAGLRKVAREEMCKLVYSAAAVSREEMCKQITVYSAAELKLVEYAEANVTSCGIPVQIVNQWKETHGHTEQTKEKICAPEPSSLSDAFGTTRRPTPEVRRCWLRVLFRAVSGHSAALSPKSAG